MNIQALMPISLVSVKIVLCTFFIAGGTALGFRYARRLNHRKMILSELISGLQLFQNEIYYTRERLEAIAWRLGRISEGAAAGFFRTFAGLLDERSEQGAELLWDEAVDICFPAGAPLHKNDTEALRALGVRLGATDVEGQCGNIGRTIKELSVRFAEADETERQKAKLYKTAGAAAGVLCAVLIV